MNHARYVQALVSYAEQVGDVTPLEDMRDAAFASIQSGNGKTLRSASPGGKSFEFEITMTADQQFAACVEAINQYNAAPGTGPITFLDFSCM